MKFLVYCDLDNCTDEIIEAEITAVAIEYYKLGEHAWAIKTSEEGENTKSKGNPIPDMQNVFYSHILQYYEKSKSGTFVIEPYPTSGMLVHTHDNVLSAFLNTSYSK